MRALILGSGGQVGRALRASVPHGIEVEALTHDSCDATDESAVRSAVIEACPDIVINAAGYTAVDRAEAEPDAARMLNAEAPALIAAAARAAQARTIHLSTDFVFGGAAVAPRRTDDPPTPESVYGRTKLEGEQAVAERDPASLVVRTSWVYAPWGHNFVNTMLKLMRERDEVRVVEDQIGTPTWAPSLAGAIWSLAKAGAQGIWHFTDAGVASWYDFAVAIEEEARAAGLLDRPAHVLPVSSAEYPAAAKRPAFSVLDKSATWALLGPARSWRVNLRANMMELRK